MFNRLAFYLFKIRDHLCRGLLEGGFTTRLIFIKPSADLIQELSLGFSSFPFVNLR